MILAIDIGNTDITLGGFEAEELRFVSRLFADCKRTDDEYAVGILNALGLYGIGREEIDGVIIASVVPALNGVLKNAVKFLFEKDALLVGPGIKSGIGIRCDIPSSVGADLIAASVAAHYIYGSPALIVDIGTATKMTVVDKNGAFIGTSIIPGVVMGINALANETAQLPQVSLEVPSSVIAKNTADCMRSGVIFGNACLIDGMIDRINEEQKEELKVVATGAMASLIIPLCKHNITTDEHLVLKGLNILYRKNRL